MSPMGLRTILPQTRQFSARVVVAILHVYSDVPFHKPPNPHLDGNEGSITHYYIGQAP